MIKRLLRPMPIPMIRRFILSAIALILFWNIIFWIGEAWNKLSGVIWGIVTAALAVFCRYKAGKSIQVNKQFMLWMSIPAVLTVIPFIVRLIDVFKQDQMPSAWLMLWQLAPLLISFILPVGLLMVAYWALKQHLPTTEVNEKPSHTPPAT